MKLRLLCTGTCSISGLLVFATAMVAQVGRPPVPPSPPPATPSSLPADVLYRAFFRHVEALDQAAAAVESKQGKNGSDLRNYYQRILGLTDQEAAVLKQVASACNHAVQQQDERARNVINAARSQTPRLLASAAAIPAPPAALKQLGEGRTSISTAYLQSLQSSLGSGAATKLDDYVRKKFAPNVSSVPIVKHTPKDKVSLPPFSPTGAAN